MPLNYNTFANYFVDMRPVCPYINTSYELTAMTSVTRSMGIHVFYFTGICSWTNMPAALYMSHCTSNCSLHIDPALLYIFHQKINKHASLIYHSTQKYVSVTNMPLKCQIYGICPKYFIYIKGGGHMQIYMSHMNPLACNPCDMGCCTQMIMTLMLKMTQMPMLSNNNDNAAQLH